MPNKGPILLIALAVANWLPQKITNESNSTHFVLLDTSKVESKTIRTFPMQDQPDEKKILPFGNLQKLNLSGIGGHLVLNGIELEKIRSDSIDLESVTREFRVRATFLKTVVVS